MEQHIFAGTEDVAAGDFPRVIVITGATSGIGRQITKRAAASGYDVVAHYHSNQPGANALQVMIASLGRRCWLVQADLSLPDGIDRVVERVQEVIGDARLHGLVNNAAKLLGPPFDQATIDDFDTYFALNTRAPFFLSQRLSRLMPPGASIVNISSASAHFSSPGDIVYAMSKAAIESMNRNMAEAIAPRGLRVNAVVPGFTNNGHPAFTNEPALEYMSSFAVLGGVSDATTVAEAVLFLLSDASARTTGAVLDVSGGSTLGARGVRAPSVRDLL